jgi:hypothetical protein
MADKHSGEWGPSKWDTGHRLSDPHINPAMRAAAESAFREAVAIGLHPRIGPEKGGYRDPQQSDAMHKAYLQGQPGATQAAPGWHSAHNYGLALDIYLIDKSGQLVDESKRPGDDYSLLIELLQRHGFAYGAAGPNDRNHFQYQPDVSHGIQGAEWVHLRDWAFGMAKASEHDSAAMQAGDWLQYIWSAVGAGGPAPASGPNGPELGQTDPDHSPVQADATAVTPDGAPNFSGPQGPDAGWMGPTSTPADANYMTEQGQAVHVEAGESAATSTPAYTPADANYTTDQNQPVHEDSPPDSGDNVFDDMVDDTY